INSTVGRGSRFAIVAPLAPAQAPIVERRAPAHALDVSSGKLVVVIDDDERALDGMGGLLRSWGCRVVTGDTDAVALCGLAAHDQPPDLIISDYRLPEGRTGIETIDRVRSEFGV